MWKSITFIFLYIFFASKLQAYDFEPYYNRPTSNEQVQNEFSEYMQNVQSKLQKNWIVPDFLEDGHLKVLFKIDRDGNVISGDILESSGNPIYDESAINAIHKSEPFGKFPENSTCQYLTINYSFDMTLIKKDKIKELYKNSQKYMYSDKNLALQYVNDAIKEVGLDDESHFLYTHRAKIKEAMGDQVGAKSDIEIANTKKKHIDIKRVHYLKHRAEIENNAFIYYYLAYAYEQIKDYDGAIWAINKAIESTDLNQKYKRYRTKLVKYQEDL